MSLYTCGSKRDNAMCAFWQCWQHKGSYALLYICPLHRMQQDGDKCGNIQNRSLGRLPRRWYKTFGRGWYPAQEDKSRDLKTMAPSIASRFKRSNHEITWAIIWVAGHFYRIDRRRSKIDDMAANIVPHCKADRDSQ